MYLKFSFAFSPYRFVLSTLLLLFTRLLDSHLFFSRFIILLNFFQRQKILTQNFFSVSFCEIMHKFFISNRSIALWFVSHSCDSEMEKKKRNWGMKKEKMWKYCRCFFKRFFLIPLLKSRSSIVHDFGLM